MNDPISEVRKARLKEWINRDFGGKVAAFCSHYMLGKSIASYISQLFSGGRSFGEKAARKLETQTGLPTGWFDAEALSKSPVPSYEPPPFHYDGARVARLPASERYMISEFIEFVTARYEMRHGDAAQSPRRQSATATPALTPSSASSPAPRRAPSARAAAKPKPAAKRPAPKKSR